MANLTASQKKKRNTFVALLIGIIVVLGLIAYVLYSNAMSKSAFLENQDFATALSEVYGERARSVSAEDLQKAKYVEIAHDTEADTCSVAIGFDDFMEKYNDVLAKSDAGEEVTDTSYVELIKSAVFEADDELVLGDIKYFTGAEVVSLNGVNIGDNAILGQFKNLKRGYFSSCGITDVSAFASLDLTKIEELNFTGNTIEDWTALESIADKVIVSSSYGVEMGEDGNYTLVPMEVTLADQMAEAEAEAEGEAEGETAEEVTEEVAEETAEEVTEETTEEAPVEEAEEEVTEEVPVEEAATEETEEVTE